MSSATDFVDQIFHASPLADQYSRAVAYSDLEIGLLQACKLGDMIFDLAVHPKGEIDPEAIAAVSRSLLALLGRLGQLGDAMEQAERGREALACATAAVAAHS